MHEFGPADGARVEHGSSLRPERAHAPAHGFGNPDRLARPEQLDEGRIAACLVAERADRLRRALASDQLGDGVDVETAELDPLDRQLTAQDCDHVRERMILGVAIGRDEQLRRAAGPRREVRKQAKCRWVRPVEIVEHEQQRHACGHCVEDRADLLEQPEQRCGRRHDRAELRDPRAPAVLHHGTGPGGPRRAVGTGRGRPPRRGRTGPRRRARRVRSRTRRRAESCRFPARR